MGPGGLTRFETLSGALRYNFSVMGTQLMCNTGGEHYAKFLKAHDYENSTLVSVRDQVMLALEMGWE